MSLYRFAGVVLAQDTPTDADVTSRVWRVRPAEGDAVTDPAQAWRCHIIADRTGAGSVTLELQTSYDREVWVDIASAEMGAQDDVALIPAIEVLAPFVRARARVAAPQPGDPPPSYRTRVRLVSNGPFKLEPV